MTRALVPASVLAVVVALAACGGGNTARTASKGPMPEGGTYTGIWYSPEYGEMHLIQTGSAVRGWFQLNERSGNLQGEVKGNVLKFRWEEKREMVVGKPTETKGRGYFVYDIETTEHGHQIHKLLGEWGHDNAERGGGPWTATKARSGTPKRTPFEE
jgi:predicted small secreted protein